MEKIQRDLLADAIARIEYCMTPAEAVEQKICMRCTQRADNFDAVINIYCMLDYLETGLCVTCRNEARKEITLPLSSDDLVINAVDGKGQHREIARTRVNPSPRSTSIDVLAPEICAGVKRSGDGRLGTYLSRKVHETATP